MAQLKKFSNCTPYSAIGLGASSVSTSFASQHHTEIMYTGMPFPFLHSRANSIIAGSSVMALSVMAVPRFALLPPMLSSICSRKLSMKE